MKKLEICKEIYEGVTSTPHFSVTFDYVGVTLHHEDIYFDYVDEVEGKLRLLSQSRKGKLELDGGSRLRMSLIMQPRGNLEINFKVESEGTFPGSLVLEGFFRIDGEYVGEVLEGLIALFSSRDKGEVFVIEEKI